jgi:hypothetical protein
MNQAPWTLACISSYISLFAVLTYPPFRGWCFENGCLTVEVRKLSLYSSILQASDSAVLENLGTFEATSFKWNVDLAAGTSFYLSSSDPELIIL